MTLRFPAGRTVRFALVFIALCFLFTISSYAARVTPMVVELKPTGRDSIARIQLTNDAPRDIAYEVQMMRGDISEDGELSLTPADEEFVVFPPQALVEGMSQQVFRIQYVGEEALDRSQIYYMSIKQVPVAFEENESQVQLVINFNILVIVEPEGATAAPSLRSAEYIEREKPVFDDDQLLAQQGSDMVDQSIDRPPAELERGVLVDIANDGTRHFNTASANLTVTGTTLEGEAFEKTFSRQELGRLLGVGVVGPGKNRKFFFAVEEELVPDSVRVTLDR